MEFLQKIFNKVALSILGLLLTQAVLAQVAPVQNQYYLNPYIYNPASVGSDGRSLIHFGMKKQWVEVEGSPTIATLTFEKPLENVLANRASLGARLVNISEGPINSLAFQSTLGYRLEVGLDSYVNFGMSLGFIYNSFNAGALDASNDPLVQEQGAGVFNFDGAVGFTYESHNFTAGLAFPKFTAPRPFANNNDPETTYGPWDYLVGSLAYKLEPSIEWEITPMFLYYLHKGVNNQWEAALKAVYQKKITGGAMYRQNLGLSIFAGYTLNEKLGFHYLYSFSSPTAQLPNDSHELVLRFAFGKEIKR